jgi:DNA repair exonuclease SbcCD ATPase subunit
MSDHDGGDATYWRGLYQKAQAELLKVNDQLQVETGRANEVEASAATIRDALDRGISALNHLPPDEGPIRKLAGAAIAVMRAAKEDDVGRALLDRLHAAEKLNASFAVEQKRIAEVHQAHTAAANERIAELQAEVERLRRVYDLACKAAQRIEADRDDHKAALGRAVAALQDTLRMTCNCRGSDHAAPCPLTGVWEIVNDLTSAAAGEAWRKANGK